MGPGRTKVHLKFTAKKSTQQDFISSMKGYEMFRMLKKNYSAIHKLCSPVESCFSTGQRRNYHQHPHETQNHQAKKKK